MLLGQNVNSYGRVPETGLDFAGLLRRVSETGIPRIRFMTSHPKDLSDALIEEIGRNPRVMGHFHLPAQSGNDRILQAMNRHYTVDQYMERAEKLRRARPDIGLTTDLIVGFPGETEAEFAESVRVAREIGFTHAHIFPYSKRPGTVAAGMDGQIPPPVKKERAAALAEAADEASKRFFASMEGARRVVLWERFEPECGCLTGYTDNYVKVYRALDADGAAALANTFETVTIGPPFRNGVLAGA
jgi:tRNA-2-methylthio-N6-dimethylallyladenosine synthase